MYTKDVARHQKIAELGKRKMYFAPKLYIEATDAEMTENVCCELLQRVVMLSFQQTNRGRRLRYENGETVSLLQRLLRTMGPSHSLAS